MGNPSTRAGLKAAGQWVSVEFGVRSLGAGLLILSLSIPVLSGTAFTISVAMDIVAILLLGVLFRRRTRREALSWQRLGYARPTRPIVVAGLIAGALLLLSIGGVTAPLDLFLFPEGAKLAASMNQQLREAGLLAAALHLPSNGIIVPIVEEYAWRGYIQTRLMEGLGMRNGLVVTALLFALKHVVVDFSVLRLTTLLVFSFAIGLVRIQWSTTATTITHVVANLAATSGTIAEAFVGALFPF